MILLDLKIGNTSLIKYDDIYIKKESDNLTGSIKDRSAYEIISRNLDPSKTIVICTSGNMGISFSRLCEYYKQPLIVVMPRNEVKKKIIENRYTKVIETDIEKGIRGAMKEFQKYRYDLQYKLINQFNTLYNPLGYFPLVKEIIKEFKELDYVICGVGTGGTYYTLSKVLKKLYPKVLVLGVTTFQNEIIDGIGSNYHGFIYREINTKNIYSIKREDALNEYNITTKEGYNFGLSTCACIVLKKQLDLKGTILIINADGADKYTEYLC